MAHALGRIGNMVFGRYGTHARFWTVALIGGISIEAFFVPATDGNTQDTNIKVDSRAIISV